MYHKFDIKCAANNGGTKIPIAVKIIITIKKH